MTKKKLWGKIEKDLEPGSYRILVENNYRIGDLKIGKGI
jgi:hypothetical protein